MPNRVKLPLLQTTYNKRYMKSGSSQKLTNIYLEPIPEHTGNPGMAAIRTPGTELYLNLTGNQIRSLLSFQGSAYAVVDSRVVKIDKVGNQLITSELGNLASSTGRVSVSANPGGIVWCDGEKAYLSVGGGLITDITNTINLGALPVWTTYKDSFTLYLTDVENIIFISDSQDPSTVNPLNYVQVFSNTDPLVSAEASDYYLYFFGKTGTEVWVSSGAQFVPFERVPGGIMGVGNAAKFSSSVINNNVYWLAQSDQGLLGIAVANGPQYQIITQDTNFVSTVGRYSNINEAFSYVEVHEGHIFYNICFPRAELITSNLYRGRTWTLDTVTGVLFERDSKNNLYNARDRHVANCSMYFDGKQIIGDYQSGKLYESHLDYTTENGNTIPWSIECPTIQDRDLFFSITNLQLNMERGQAIDGDDLGSDPLVCLEVSKDNGYTWGRKMLRNIGKMGDYLKRIRWGSLGGGRYMTLRFSGSDPIRTVITGITAELMTNSAETPRSQ